MEISNGKYCDNFGGFCGFVMNSDVSNESDTDIHETENESDDSNIKIKKTMAQHQSFKTGHQP